MIEDYCKLIREIEADPYALVPNLTIRDYFMLKEHIFNCDACFNSTERVLAREDAPKRNVIGFGEN